MTGKPTNGEPDQVTIETFLIGATLVAGGADAQLLRIGMGGPVQRISMRPTEIRPLLLQYNQFGEDLALHLVS